MRIVLMGTGPFAVPAFSAIADAGLDNIVTVVSKPDAGTPNKPIISPVTQWARDTGFSLWQPATLRDDDAINALCEFDCELAVVCDYGQILTQAALESFSFGAINLHGSVLPRHRGAAPIQWSLLLGDRTSGATVIRMTTGLDSGPILATVETEIDALENAMELESRLSQLGAPLTLDALNQVRMCKTRDDFYALGEKQNKDLATKAPRLNKSDGQLDFRLSAVVLARIIRAMQPWPGAFAELEVEPNKVLRVMLHRATHNSALLPNDIVPGVLLTEASLRERGIGIQADLAIATGDGWLTVESIQPSGKRVMRAKEFAAGYCRSKSIRFLHPSSTSLII